MLLNLYKSEGKDDSHTHTTHTHYFLFWIISKLLIFVLFYDVKLSTAHFIEDTRFFSINLLLSASSRVHLRRASDPMHSKGLA